MGAFYNANIRGNFDCQINPIPGNSDLPTPPANPNVYLSQEGMQGDHFGAIAFSTKTGATGYSYDYGSGIDAQNAALYSCGPDCTVVSVFTNACGAFAVGANRGWGSAWASSGSQAQINAMNSCSARTLDCTVVQWACTTR
jgi:hypothetical protein